jgi:hypothetical protein
MKAVLGEKDFEYGLTGMEGRVRTVYKKSYQGTARRT